MYFNLFPGRDGNWYWNFQSDNGEEIYRSSEGYTSRQNAVYSIGLVRTHAVNAPVWDKKQHKWVDI